MENKTYVIDLENYRPPGAKVFTNKPRGEEVRDKSKINEIEPKYNKIIIKIPREISSVNPSFLEEFLEKIVVKLGRTEFYNKFSFENEGRYKIDNDLEEAIDRIIRENRTI